MAAFAKTSITSSFVHDLTAVMLHVVGGLAFAIDLHWSMYAQVLNTWTADHTSP